ncbi:TetR/AcrR family transcriptional regulator [Nocardioides daejeonensis]|uniref:TetR/AcrR family transcriptional regulator n=1 Tax=Nocardioides daejeonensis TaxID=1046556 RepID=UPI000D74F088|nr:TetR/AcrR family transcriptional regulator [Nocardioides daejeonensis]
MLAATRALVAESGYSGLTFRAIADRAGTSQPALRRRWRTKAQVVHEAVFPTSAAAQESTGELRGDVRQVVASCVALLSSEAGRRATPGLMADLTADPDLQRELSARMWTAVGDGLAARLADAVTRGEAAHEPDVTLFVEMVFGTVLMAVVLRGPEGLDDAWQDGLTTMLLDGLATSRPTE